jgi:hypothetical protein
VLFIFLIVIVVNTLCTHLLYIRSQFHFSIGIRAWYTLRRLISLVLFLNSLINMSQTLNIVHAFDGTNYGYWKALMWFFLKSIDFWSIVETGWTKPEDTTLELVPQKNTRLSNDKDLHALCQALSPSEFAKISNHESAQEA